MDDRIHDLTGRFASACRLVLSEAENNQEPFSDEQIKHAALICAIATIKGRTPTLNQHELPDDEFIKLTETTMKEILFGIEMAIDSKSQDGTQ